MGIILIAFIILGTFLMVFVHQFWDTRNINKAKEDLNSYQKHWKMMMAN